MPPLALHDITPNTDPDPSAACLGMPRQQCQPGSSSSRHLLRQQPALGRSFGRVGRSLHPPQPRPGLRQPRAAWAFPQKEALAEVCFLLLLCNPHLDEPLVVPPAPTPHMHHCNTIQHLLLQSLPKCCSLSLPLRWQIIVWSFPPKLLSVNPKE